MRTKEQQQYLSNLAATTLQQLRVPDEYGESADGSAKLFREFGTKVRIKVAEMTPETRGKIAELGLSGDDHSGISMFQATGIGNLSCRYHGGSWLIVELATMTIVAMMYELLCAEAYRRHEIDSGLEQDEREFEMLTRRHRRPQEVNEVVT